MLELHVLWLHVFVGYRELNHMYGEDILSD